MTGSDRERLRRLMGEAAALSPDDELRREIEAELGTVGRWAEEEWLAMLRFDERTRLALNRVPPPPQLERELLAIPDAGSRRRFAVHRPAWLPAAASVLLAALVAMVVFVLQRPDHSRAAHHLALLTMSEHFGAQTVTIETSDPRVLERTLSAMLPFRVVLPELGARYTLLGGRKCSLGSQPVAYSLWRSGTETYSLYQFPPSAFRLAGTAARTTVPGEGARCQVIVWSEDERGYAFVGFSNQTNFHRSVGSRHGR